MIDPIYAKIIENDRLVVRESGGGVNPRIKPDQPSPNAHISIATKGLITCRPPRNNAGKRPSLPIRGTAALREGAMQRILVCLRRVDALAKSKGFRCTVRAFSTSPTKMSEEDARFDAQVKDVEAWFASPRFAGIKRPYTAASVVEKRGTLPITYPCDHQARKLWDLLQKYGAEKKPLLTMGAIDPVQMTQMAPNQDVLYVSGWACSSVLASGNHLENANLTEQQMKLVPTLEIMRISPFLIKCIVCSRRSNYMIKRNFTHDDK